MATISNRILANYDGAEIITGSIVTIVGIVLLVIFYTSNRGAGLTGYEISAHLAKADGLSVGSDVRIAGVEVGKVSGLVLNSTNYMATVRMTIKDGVNIPVDSSLNCTSDGLLGSVHLDILPGRDRSLMQSGGVITRARACSADVMSRIEQIGLGSN
jgi:phospholipid/cholesterol/gamma-HCH transport system substrate-binding protein